jgi:uncharacterized protein (TIGR02001 family)
MKKVVLSVVAALAFSAAPALAADMPVKAAPAAPAAAPSQWDVLFGTAFTTNYVLRGISQSDRKPAVQGYFEVDFKPTDWVTLYAGIWGSSITTVIANAEFDNSAGARFSWGNFGLDLGAVYYYYPDPSPGNVAIFFQGKSSIDYAEFYAKPSYKVADWLTVSGQVIGGGDYGNTGQSAWYFSGMVTVTPPLTLPAGVTLSASAEVGRQTYSSGYVAIPGVLIPGVQGGVQDYTQWNAGIDLVYKAITLDLRYYDTDIDINNNPTQCATGPTFTTDACKAAFVAMLKFDAALSGLK